MRKEKPPEGPTIFSDTEQNSSREEVREVKPACDERVNKPLGGLTRQILPNVPDIVQIIKRASTSLRHMSRHVQMRIEPGAQIARN